MGDEVLLGAVPMDDMDVLISSRKQDLVVNSEIFNIAIIFAKCELVEL